MQLFLKLVCIQLVDHLPRMQNIVGSSPAEAAHFSLKMTRGELHCVALGVSCMESLEPSVEEHGCSC